MDIDKLKNMIQDGHINFLFGSGMSAPYLSTLWNIEILLTDLMEDASLDSDEEELIKASLYKKFFDDVMKKNMDILDNDASSEDVMKSYRTFFSVINRLMLIRRNKLLSKQVNIFTTNIDICLEKSLEDKGFESNDGFIGRFKPKYDLSNFKKSIYKNSLHYDNSSEIPVFNILKLHGSLTWSVSEDKNIICDTSLEQVKKVKHALTGTDDDFIEIGQDDTYDVVCEKVPDTVDNSPIQDFISEYEKLAIINPNKDKFRDTLLNQTYYELLRIYSNELEKENALLFVMGFSFADEHIRELTLRVANSNPTLTIIIFTYTNAARADIERNIDMSKVKNNNIIFENPTTTTDEDTDTTTDDFKYDFNNINSRIFQAVLTSIEKKTDE